MSHYSGDIAMPYHAATDSNGYARGEGGIHFYFENACVEVSEPGLAEDVLASARKHRAKWLASWGGPKTDPARLVRTVLEESLAAVETVSALDKKHAILKPSPPGVKTDAVRKPAEAGCAPMRRLLVERLAKAAVVTALLWESVLPAGVEFSRASPLHFSDMETCSAYPAPR
jgi:hypothetical protein